MMLLQKNKRKNINKKILFILESFYPNVGGVEYLFKLLTERLAFEYEITVLTAKSLAEISKENIDLNNSTIRLVTIPFRSRYLFTFFAFFYAIKLMPTQDLIHTTSYNAALPAYLAAKLFNKKIVITFHEYWGNLWFKLPYLNWVQRRLCYYFEKFIVNLKFDKYIAVSEATRKALISTGIGRDKIVRIYNGIEYDQLKINPAQREKLKIKNRFVFLFFGRAGVSKGLDVLIEAVKLTKALEYKLIIQSSDPRQFGVLKKLEVEIKKNELSAKVVLQKMRLNETELKKLISGSDCVIIPSYTEGFCFSAVEACASGVPVIHSGKGSLPEVVSGKCLSFENMNPADLAKKMKLATENKFEQKALKKFEIKNSVGGYMRLYEELMYEG